MGEWLLRKPEPANVRGLCAACGERPQKPITRKSKKFGDAQLYMNICTGCNKRRQKSRHKIWIKY